MREDVRFLRDGTDSDFSIHAAKLKPITVEAPIEKLSIEFEDVLVLIGVAAIVGAMISWALLGVWL